jgi:methyl-accepting chemotaxis protein
MKLCQPSELRLSLTAGSLGGLTDPASKKDKSMAQAKNGESAALQERLDFIGMDAKSRATLTKLQPFVEKAMGTALDAFYRKLKQTPEVARHFVDEKRIAGAKSAQQSHWKLIASARFDQGYVESAQRIGRTHARIGLEPRWYIGGYALIVEQLIRAFAAEHWPTFLGRARGGGEEFAASLSCLVKGAVLDMDYAITTYWETLEGQRRQAEEAQATIKREAAVAVDAIALGLSKLAAKDLTYRMPANLAEGFRKVATDFNEAIAQVADTMVNVADSVNAVRTGTEQISTASDDLSRRTEQQAASLEETAAALDEITATVKRSSDGANHARTVVTTANEDAKTSSAVVAQTVEAMDAIAKSSQQIGQIIGVIDEIAFQTNLLALNAGVEAARAGEAGRGFAVVASEVRALAQRSAQAAKEIKDLISTSSAQVDRGVQLVAETGKSLDRIMSKVGEISTVIMAIAGGAKEQATGLSEINTAINQMDQMTQQNAAMAEEATAASRSLSEESERLSELVGQFDVAGRRAGKSRQPGPRSAPRTPSDRAA